MMNQKLCINCNLHRKDFKIRSHVCIRNVKYDYSLVDGHCSLNNCLYCDEERQYNKLLARLFNTCGKEGRFFVKKDNVDNGEIST